jgi:hypothetical protein
MSPVFRDVGRMATGKVLAQWSGRTGHPHRAATTPEKSSQREKEYVMSKIVNSVLVAAIAIGVTAGAALAQYNEPNVAKAVKGSIVTAYQPCTTPNTTTSNATPACTVVRNDPICGFAGLGHGLMFLKSKGTTGWAVKIVLLGLEDACKNQTLHFYATLRTTTNDCAQSPCTVDTPNVDLGSCIVTHTGKCGISTPVFATPALITKAGGSEVTDLHAVRTTGTGAPATSFTYGIVTKFGS